MLSDTQYPRSLKIKVPSTLYYAGEIWKRGFHSENPSNVFRPYYAEEI